MNVTRPVGFVIRAATVAALVVPTARPLAAQGGQAAAAPPVARLVAEPTKLTVRVGDSVAFKVTAYDARGTVMTNAIVRVTGPRRSLAVNGGFIRGFTAGQFTATATAAGRDSAITLEIPVMVTWPALSKLQVVPAPGRLYAGLTIAHTVKGWHADSSERTPIAATWTSSNPAIATVDRFGNVTAMRTGPVTITASVDNLKAAKIYSVAPNPVTKIVIKAPEKSIRTGDVVHLVATATRADGSAVTDAPITWSYTYTPDDSIQAPGGAGIIDGGLFAANYGGRYTLLAYSGSANARAVVEVAPRDVRQKFQVTSRGTINNQHTSDLWPWEGKDGRDYCLVGTWGSDGFAIVFDITDMNNIVKTDSVQVNARTINDVTVSPDGRWGALSREGASDRVNGVVILDLSNPAHPKVASTFSQELTGGVHNMFATNDNLFAVSGGQKYVIVDMKDITKPKFVSEYRHPNARIHDLWVHDGIAYSAQGGVGTVAVDVGNGKYGGSLEKPKLINVFRINSGHEIFPYFQKSTGKVYMFMGDEEMNRQGRVWEGTGYSLSGPDGKPPKGGIAQSSGGYTHIIDFTDPMNPKKVARYHLEDYGSHDIIVKDDILYQAYYDGGVRVVDVSGELLGNLHDQGREIAVFKSYDPDGYTANAPFVMNAMPWKGKILFTDFNSGLWGAKLVPRPAPKIAQ